MGTEWHGICLDCRVMVDLDKLYSIPFIESWLRGKPGADETEEIVKDRLSLDAYRMLRWLAFGLAHPGHRLEIFHEQDDRLDYDKDATGYYITLNGERLTEVWPADPDFLDFLRHPSADPKEPG